MVLATSHLGLLNAGLGWPHARHLVRSGKDGADLELLDVLEHENVATRFRHVVIGSGDGGFSGAAASLAARGVHVTVVSRRGSLAQTLASVAARGRLPRRAPWTPAAAATGPSRVLSRLTRR